MTTPLESIENTVARLRVKVGPHGYHADEIARLEAKLEDAVQARDNDEQDLLAWEKILDTLKKDQEDLERCKAEFLRRHPDTSKFATGGRIEDYNPDRQVFFNGSCVIGDPSRSALPYSMDYDQETEEA